MQILEFTQPSNINTSYFARTICFRIGVIDNESTFIVRNVVCGLNYIEYQQCISLLVKPLS